MLIVESLFWDDSLTVINSTDFEPDYWYLGESKDRDTDDGDTGTDIKHDSESQKNTLSIIKPLAFLVMRHTDPNKVRVQ